MYFISPVKYWARVHNGLILGGIKSDKSQILHEARQYDLLCGPDWEMWRMKEADEDNERAGTAIWPEEMVAHSLTLETLETLVTTPSSLSADLALAQLIVSTPLCSLCSALVFKISKHNPQKALSISRAGRMKNYRQTCEVWWPVTTSDQPTDLSGDEMYVPDGQTACRCPGGLQETSRSGTR